MYSKQYQSSSNLILVTSELTTMAFLFLFLLLITGLPAMATGAGVNSDISSRQWNVYLKPLVERDQNPDKEIQITLYRRRRRTFIKEYERTIVQGVLEDGTYSINLPNHALGGGRYYEPYFLFVQIGESLHAGQVLESSSLSPGTECSPIRFYRSGKAQDSNRLGKVKNPAHRAGHMKIQL